MNTIYLIGPCITWSLFSNNENSLGLFLQDYLLKTNLKYRVKVIALPNDADRVYYFRRINKLNLVSGDKIFWLEQTFKFVKWDLDLLPVFKALKSQYSTDFYYDLPVHCGSRANKQIAEFLYDYISEHPETPKIEFDEMDIQTDDFQPALKKLSGNLQLIEYKKFITGEAVHKMPKIGSIVMNCNPFTLGHLYLIEYAAS